MAFFRKADAKVRLIFELPKLFEVFFEKFLFQCWRSVSSSMLQYFITTAFLSRKRMQNYCFTTYLPNVYTPFFQTFCKLFANSLICRYVLRHDFYHDFQERVLVHLIIIICARNWVCAQSPQGFDASLLLKPQRLFFFLLSAQKKKKQNAPAALFCLLRHFSTLNKKNSLRSNSFLFLTLRKAPALNGKKLRPEPNVFHPTSLRSLAVDAFLLRFISFFLQEKVFRFSLHALHPAGSQSFSHVENTKFL